MEKEKGKKKHIWKKERKKHQKTTERKKKGGKKGWKKGWLTHHMENKRMKNVEQVAYDVKFIEGRIE